MNNNMSVILLLGLILISNELEELCQGIINGKIPTAWARNSYTPFKLLATGELCERFLTEKGVFAS